MNHHLEVRAGFHGSEPGRDNASAGDHQNVGDAERMASIAAGATLLAVGLSGRSISRVIGLIVGGGLIYRGIEGHCALYQALGISTAQPQREATAVPAGCGVKVEKSIVVAVPAEEAYRFWRTLTNVTRVLPRIESVRETDPKHSVWTARAPGGATLQWQAEIIEDRLGEIISWRSMPDSEVDTAGSIRFIPLGMEDETEVRISMKYDPPGGRATAMIADFFGVSLEQELEEGLACLKETLEERTNVAQSASRGRNGAFSS